MKSYQLPGGPRISPYRLGTSLSIPGYGTLAGSLPSLFYVVYQANLANPTASQVINAQSSDNLPALTFGSILAPAAPGGVYTFPSTIPGLNYNTSYKLAIVWSNGITDSNVLVSTQFECIEGVPWLSNVTLSSITSTSTDVSATSSY